MAASPIADLSYRNYDGGLESPRLRWWVIARMGMRLAFKKKSYWVFMALSGWYFLAMMFILFIFEQIASQAVGRAGMNPGQAFLNRISWTDQFLHGLSFGQLPFLILALLLGAGTIANDNRANALLVYLSKPCTKRDYLWGKWMGIFIPLFIAMIIPSTIFYLYGVMSYREYGFGEDKLLLLKVWFAAALMSAFHSSLIIGISSMFKQGRLAGASYAGLYFLTTFFTNIMVIIWVSSASEQRPPSEAALALVKRLYYASIDGVNIGVVKSILRTDGSPWFGIDNPGFRAIERPSIAMVGGAMILLSVISMLIAWRRIRAVEVVG